MTGTGGPPAPEVGRRSRVGLKDDKTKLGRLRFLHNGGARPAELCRSSEMSVHRWLADIRGGGPCR